jgi:dipeptidase E
MINVLKDFAPCFYGITTWLKTPAQAVLAGVANSPPCRLIFAFGKSAIICSADPNVALYFPANALIRFIGKDTIMKCLLTSGGIKNTRIHNALVDLLGKPIAECSALCIPTASYALPNGPIMAARFISGQEPDCPMCELGWKSLGVLELTALSSIDEALWVPLVREADVLLVNGGDPLYLCYWMRQSGLAALLPSLRAVYVGLSAGSMVMTPNIGKEFVGWKPPTGGDETLGLVDFALFPHLDHVMLPENTMVEAERWAAGMRVPAYAIDDETAIKVVNGAVEVVSEGHWKRFTP